MEHNILKTGANEAVLVIKDFHCMNDKNVMTKCLRVINLMLNHIKCLFLKLLFEMS